MYMIKVKWPPGYNDIHEGWVMIFIDKSCVSEVKANSAVLSSRWIIQGDLHRVRGNMYMYKPVQYMTDYTHKVQMEPVIEWTEYGAILEGYWVIQGLLVHKGLINTIGPSLECIVHLWTTCLLSFSYLSNENNFDEKVVNTEPGLSTK